VGNWEVAGENLENTVEKRGDGRKKVARKESYPSVCDRGAGDDSCDLKGTGDTETEGTVKNYENKRIKKGERGSGSIEGKNRLGEI